jgi:hypothetical protein
VTHEADVACSREEASAEAVNADAYATRYQSEWFWQGLAKLKGTAD